MSCPTSQILFLPGAEVSCDGSDLPTPGSLQMLRSVCLFTHAVVFLGPDPHFPA